ncbi:MAG: bifunctional ornithine acetyltransferase/N-acetylglutamate synthase, partial [Pseudomonadota bacterium]|nr:bifunctional ornithine acetyltransferase/N-acetylglutamate synthase [Pseudomonadota bacterium]
MPFKISPLAPKQSKKFQIINGVKVSIAHCGLKKNNKEDLVLIKFDNPSTIFGAYTRSKTPGHPIIWNKSISKYGKVSAILINSGNANVFTGREGKKSIKLIIEKLSKN